MPGEPRIVHIPDSSELAPLLEDPDLEHLWLEHRGVLFQVSRNGEECDAATVEARDESVRHLERAIGSWRRAGIDAEAFKEYLRERRKIRSRPSVRL